MAVTVFFSLVLVLIEKIYKTLKKVFIHTSKHLEARQKHSVTCRIFNSLLHVCKLNAVKHHLSCLIYIKTPTKTYC